MNEMRKENIVVLDSGGGSCKVGIAGPTQQAWLLCAFANGCRCFPNAVAKTVGDSSGRGSSKGRLVGEDILHQKDVSSIQLRRPVDRGYVVDWDLEKEIWGHGFKKVLAQQTNADESQDRKQRSGLGIVVTEPYMNLNSMREKAMKMLLEDMRFSSVLMLYPATLSLYHMAAKGADNYVAKAALEAGAGVVIDAGFSFTHVVPLFDWHPIKSAIRRIDLGGKALTNLMKELVSFRSMNMMKETYLMDYIKDKLCFVSQNVEEDLKLAKTKKSPYRTEWFLPDGVTSTWGHIRDQSQPRDPRDPILVVNNERFMVPEALFNPSDIGMDEAGLPEVVFQAVTASHPNLHGLLYSNIIVIGGIAKCPGMKERLTSEIRRLVPDDYEINITIPDDPDLVAWKGGCLLGSSSDYEKLAVTRTEWQKYGTNACAKWDA